MKIELNKKISAEVSILRDELQAQDLFKENLKPVKEFSLCLSYGLYAYGYYQEVPYFGVDFIYDFSNWLGEDTFPLTEYPFDGIFSKINQEEIPEKLQKILASLIALEDNIGDIESRILRLHYVEPEFQEKHKTTWEDIFRVMMNSYLSNEMTWHKIRDEDIISEIPLAISIHQSKGYSQGDVALVAIPKNIEKEKEKEYIDHLLWDQPIDVRVDDACIELEDEYKYNVKEIKQKVSEYLKSKGYSKSTIKEWKETILPEYI